MLQYIIECIAFQLVFLIIYDLILKRETFFQWNRFYLISTYLISMIIPWVKIEAMKTALPENFQGYSEFLWTINEPSVLIVPAGEQSFSISSEYVVLFGGMILATLFFGYKLYQILHLKRQGNKQVFLEFTQYVIANSSVAFSFLKSIFLGDMIVQKDHERILKHELVHIKQKHSYDLIFFELMRIVAWFNPLVYIYQRRVSELHEFIADAQVSKTNKKEHYQTLLSEVFQTQNISFINQFFKKSLIKKRIVMLQKTKSKKIWQLKYLLLVPLVFGMLAYTSIERDSSITDKLVLISDSDDAKLIAEIEKEIEEEAKEKGSLQFVLFSFYTDKIYNDDPVILSKRKYFKLELLFKKVVTDVNRPLPSTERYDRYVLRESTYKVLDEKLKISIGAYEQDVILLDKDYSVSKHEFVFKVNNVKELTGLELKTLNNKMSEIFETENSNYTSIILKDDNNIFEINSDGNNAGLKGHLIKLNFPSQNFEVNDDVFIATETKNLNSGDPIPFATVEEVPIFPGCEDSFDQRICFNEKIQQHIVKNFRYPKEAQDKNIEGKVYAQFTISKKGAINNLRLRGPDSLLEQEVSRIIGKLPQMKPGKHKGKKVDVPFSIPITFKLETDNNSKKDELLLEYLKSKEDSSLNGETYDFVHKEIKELSKLNVEKKFLQLIEERERLLLSSQENNYIIENLNRKIAELRKEIDQESEFIPFALVDEVPVFPSCENAKDKRACFEKALRKHVVKHFYYPEVAQENGIEGKVYLNFMIDQKGTIQNIRMRGPDASLEKAAKNIIEALPIMIPGKNKGKAVRVAYSIPITFKLQEDEKPLIKKLMQEKYDEPAPLVIIDGKESTLLELHSMLIDKIESMNILKNEAAKNAYGEKGNNGVIVVKVKKKN